MPLRGRAPRRMLGTTLRSGAERRGAGQEVRGEQAGTHRQGRGCAAAPLALAAVLARAALPALPVGAQDVDADGAGLVASLQAQLCTDPNRWDTDGDGSTDSEEVYYVTDPLVFDVDCDALYCLPPAA